MLRNLKLHDLVGLVHPTFWLDKLEVLSKLLTHQNYHVKKLSFRAAVEAPVVAISQVMVTVVVGGM